MLLIFSRYDCQDYSLYSSFPHLKRRIFRFSALSIFVILNFLATPAMAISFSDMTTYIFFL